MFAICREPLTTRGSPGPCASLGLSKVAALLRAAGLDNTPAGRILGSAVVQIPEKSGFPSASRGAGADVSTAPSTLCGTPAVGYCTHWATKSDEAEKRTRQPTATSAGQRRPIRADSRLKVKDPMRRRIQHSFREFASSVGRSSIQIGAGNVPFPSRAHDRTAVTHSPDERPVIAVRFFKNRIFSTAPPLRQPSRNGARAEDRTTHSAPPCYPETEPDIVPHV
jgi:hypothetical protein